MNAKTIELPHYKAVEIVHSSDRTFIYRGKTKEGDRPVIVKLMRNEYPSFEELVRFRNQYAIMLRIANANVKNSNRKGIVRPIALERYENRYALVMEDYGGVVLSENWNSTKNEGDTIAKFLDIAIQLATILHQLHKNRIIHKDIKPANILIHPETREVKLIDFSISSLLPKETQTIQAPNVLEGTLAYISPEQTGRMNRGIDYRSDFYSLGVTFYELLSGTLPYESLDPLELIHCHIAQPPPSTPILGGCSLGVREGSPKELGDSPESHNYSLPPTPLVDIVMKLMAKNAEDRYQNALGLKYDLEKCRQQWQESGTIKTFELGEKDICDRFLIPEKLYGREKEVQMLLDAFERVANTSQHSDPPLNPLPRGGEQEGETQHPTPNTQHPTPNAEMILVAGFSGIGKTAVINEVHKPIARQHGYFIKGKFDQFQRNIPFSAFVQAFRDLMGQLLGESDDRVTRWKQKILQALGENGQAIVDVIPELEQIIGPQPPIPELSGSATENRFKLLLQKFIRVFTTPEHPLVVFVDDLQWADSASLKLIELLIGDEETSDLLLLGAYRDNEVTPAHPLMLTLDKMRKSDAEIETIVLNPLNNSDLNQLVADTLSCSLKLALPLTKLVYRITKGNPFFVTQLLEGLHEDGWISFNANAGYWQCNMAQIRQLTLTDDVVEFMTTRLNKLLPSTREILKLAACIGNQFDLNTLAVASRKPQLEVATNLCQSLQEGFILPLSQTYKFFQGEGPTIDNISVSYQFLHDRVQQAAYSLIPEAEKQATHYRIGKLLLAHISERDREEKIFELVNHLNYGTDLISQQRDRLELARLNLAAGRKARQAIAYPAALDYATIGISLLGESPWQTQYDLCLELHELAADTAVLSGDEEQMEALAVPVIENARTLLDTVGVRRIQILTVVRHNRLTEAVVLGCDLLQKLGVNFPEKPGLEEIQADVREIETLIGDRKIETLADLPLMSDRTQLATIQIASSILVSAYLSGSPLYPLLVFLCVKLSIKYGNTLASPGSYAFYGALSCNLLGNVDAGFEFGRVSVQMTDRPELKAAKAEAIAPAVAFALHRKTHLKDLISLTIEGYTSGIEVGNLEHAGYGIILLCNKAFVGGRPLQALEREIRKYARGLPKINQIAADYCWIVWQSVLNLLGSSESPTLLSGEAIEEETFLPPRLSANEPGVPYQFYIHKAVLCFLFGDLEGAKTNIAETRQYFLGGAGLINDSTLHFYDSLILLAQFERNSGATETVLEQVAANQTRLQQWADSAPMNHQHKVCLVEAERQRVLGNVYAAGDWYDRAIARAKENEYLQDEGLANELAAGFYLKAGRDKYAALYMQEAYYCYARWDAKAKTDDLEQRYPQLLSPILNQQQPTWSADRFRTTTVSQTTTEDGKILDLASLMKASRTLSREMERDRAIANLMQVLLENAGAETVALMLFRDDTLMLEAKATNGQAEFLTALPVEESQAVPLAIVNTVKRTQIALIIDDASNDPAYLGDAYIQQYRPHSILCLPLQDRGRSLGILYLENNQCTKAFTKARVEVLSLLCAQAAITLENTWLYQQAQQALKLEKELHDLQHTQLQLIQSEKMYSLGQMVAGIAHEINNPINFISGNIAHASVYMEDVLNLLALYQHCYPQPYPELERAIAALDLHFLQEDFPKILASMQSGSKRIQEIVTSLRTFSRLDESEFKAVDLNANIKSALFILQARLQSNKTRKGIQTIEEYGQFPFLVECYAGQLNQVFLAILNNAIDAIEESLDNLPPETEYIPTIRIQTQLGEETVKIAIADNGIGMSEETQKRLFDPFFTTKPIGQGTGLGLSISYQVIVEQHRGKLSCTSRAGETQFSIELPLS
ncbi:MAG: AAA family ATPase [Cyanobacteria bacterium P01_E01_bin.42]